MRLTELKPRWLEHEGQRVAIMFLCPHCFQAKEQWLSCFFVPSGSLPSYQDGDHWINGERRLFQLEFERMVALDPETSAYNVVGCKKDIAWSRTSDDFETMSVTPSLDASASGHWHGFIRNGEVTLG